jgi:hypothetical protein
VLGPLRVIGACDHAGDDGAGLRLGGARQQVVLPAAPISDPPT